MPDQLTYPEIGCGDGNCDFRKPTGMHTNRGCKCLPTFRDYGPAERVRLRKWVRAMRDEIAESMIRASRLTEALQAATAYIDAMERGGGVTKLGPVRGAYHDALEATR